MSLSINRMDLRLLETISVRAGGILNIWTTYVAFSYPKINLARLQSFLDLHVPQLFLIETYCPS